MISVIIIAGTKEETLQIIDGLATMDVSPAVAVPSRLGTNWLKGYYVGRHAWQSNRACKKA